MAIKYKGSYDKQLKDNAIRGSQIIADYLDGAPVHDTKIKVASAAVTQHNRYRATSGALAALGFSMARSIAKDREELKRLVKPIKAIE